MTGRIKGCAKDPSPSYKRDGQASDSQAAPDNFSNQG